VVYLTFKWIVFKTEFSFGLEFFFFFLVQLQCNLISFSFCSREWIADLFDSCFCSRK